MKPDLGKAGRVNIESSPMRQSVHFAPDWAFIFLQIPQSVRVQLASVIVKGSDDHAKERSPMRHQGDLLRRSATCLPALPTRGTCVVGLTKNQFRRVWRSRVWRACWPDIGESMRALPAASPPSKLSIATSRA